MNEDIRPFIREKKIDILTFIDGSIISHTRRDEDYLQMEWLTDYYIESSRMKAYRSSRGKKLSPYEEWYVYGEYVRSAIAYTLERENDKLSFMDRVRNYNPETLYNLREGLYRQSSVEECTNESPIFLGMLYTFLGAKKIFDATAGWGDRLLAAIAIGAEKYLGIDPNTNSSAGFYEMVEELGGGDHSRYGILPLSMPCDILPEEDGTFDIGFISPPSYDSEVYSQDPGQSISLFGNKGIWMEEFMEKTVLCTLRKIKYDGYLIIQSILIEEIVPYLQGKCDFNQSFKLVFMGPISIGSEPTPQKPSPRYKPMWIWRKARDVSLIPHTRLSSLEKYRSYLRMSSHELEKIVMMLSLYYPRELPGGNSYAYPRELPGGISSIQLQEFFGDHSHTSTFLREHSLTLNIIAGHHLTYDMHAQIARLRARVWGDNSFNLLEKWSFKEDLKGLFILVIFQENIIASTCIVFHNTLSAIPSARWLAKSSLESHTPPAASIERLVIDKNYQYTVQGTVITKGGLGKMLDILAINIISLTDTRYVYCDVPPYRIKTLTSLGFSKDIFHTKRSKTSNTPEVEWTGMLLDIDDIQRGEYNAYIKYSDYAVFIPSLCSGHTYFISGDSELMKGTLRYVLEYLSPIPFKEAVGDVKECGFISQEWVRGTSRIIHSHLNILSTIKNLLDGATSITNKWNLWSNFKKYFPSITRKVMCKSRLLKSVKNIKPNEILIVRPIGKGACSGNDVYVVRSNEELSSARYATSKYTSAMVSEYIIHPLLFKTKKFHLRMYYAVTLINEKLKAYLFGIGKILTSRKVYVLSDTSKDVHDTHADSTEMNLWFPYDIEPYDSEKMYNDMADVCKYVTRILLRDGAVKCYPESKHAYEVFGCDFMFDSDYGVKLLEINDKVGYTTILEQFECGERMHNISPYQDKIYRRSFFDLIDEEDAFVDYRIGDSPKNLTFGLFSELFYKFVHDIAIFKAMA